MVQPVEPPLKGVRVVELTHTILGPSCGMILADLGAEVIKVEPVDGDRTRRLRGFGAGFFGYFNRNKKSLALDADSPEGRKVLVKLLQSADVMIENFAPGSMAKRGLGPDDLEKINPRLVYCALKGFLPGPYEKRPALDEVVQMMGGLAYMTGPSGRPLRAGTSVVDIVGGMFGAFGEPGVERLLIGLRPVFRSTARDHELGGAALDVVCSAHGRLRMSVGSA